MWYRNRNNELEVCIERPMARQQLELFLRDNLLCYTRERVKIEEKETLPHQATSHYIQFVCLSWMILQASMYHPNPSPWSYTPPHYSLYKKPCLIIRCRNTSEHFLITTYHTATTSPHFHTLPPSLRTSPPFHNSRFFCTCELIPRWHPNLSLVTRAVTEVG